MKAAQETDSLIFKIMPSLSKTDSSFLKIVSLDFKKQVYRAQAAGSEG
jgi:hypothetical protein